MRNIKILSNVILQLAPNCGVVKPLLPEIFFYIPKACLYRNLLQEISSLFELHNSDIRYQKYNG